MFNRVLLLGCLALTASALPVSVLGAERTIRLTSAENLPYWVERGERTIREAYRRLNITVEVTQLPTNRALQEANLGNFDGDLARVSSIEAGSPNLERVPTKLADFVIVPVVLTVPASGFTSYAALKESGLRIGTPLGMRATVDQLEGARLQTPTNFGSLLEMLAAHRIDVAVMPKGLFKSMLPSLPPNVQKILGSAVELPPVAAQPVYHYLHKKNADLIQPLDAELRKMTSDGTLKRIWADAN